MKSALGRQTSTSLHWLIPKFESCKCVVAKVPLLIHKASFTAFSLVADDCVNISTPVDIVLMVDGTWSIDPQKLASLSYVLGNLPINVSYIHNTIGKVVTHNKTHRLFGKLNI